MAKSGTSIGANYRGTCKARSTAELIAKLGIVVEEAEKAVFWLEVVAAPGELLPADMIGASLTEAKELLAIFSKSVGTARANARVTDVTG